MRFVVVVLALTGCISDVCEVNARRCEGDVLEECTGHPDGFLGSSYVHGIGPSWDQVATCGSCIEAADGAFCALAVDAACTEDGTVCDGTTQLDCRDGYALARARCKTCGVECQGGLFDSCATAADCADGMTCDDEHTCEQPCTTAADCAAAQEQSNDPSLGVAPVFECRAGFCAIE